MADSFPSNKKTYFITGGAGFIGFHLCMRLLFENANITVFDNLNDYYDPYLKQKRLSLLEKYSSFKFILGNLEDTESLSSAYIDCNPDIVVHLAAQAGVRYSIDNPGVYIQSNLVGFFNLLELCRKYKPEHLVYASSSSVYGANAKVPFSEDDITDFPLSLYAATKKSNELIAHSYSHLYNLMVTGVRFFTVYGPYGRPDMACFLFADSILKGNEIKIFNNGNMYRDFTYIDDIVEGLIRILNKKPNVSDGMPMHSVYNIGNNNPVKLTDFIEILELYLGRSAIKKYEPMQPGDVYRTYADISKIQMDFEFSPHTSIETGLKRFIEWFIEYSNK